MSCQEWTGVRRIDLGDGAADRWTTDCQTCGWFGPDRTTRPQSDADADADAEAHCGGGYHPPGPDCDELDPPEPHRCHATACAHETMTLEQWRSDPYRHTGLDWQPYVLRFVPGAGTCLVPVQIIEPT